MRVILCDRCGARIEAPKTGYVSMGNRNVETTGVTDRVMDFDYWDLCADCMQQIEDFVRMKPAPVPVVESEVVGSEGFGWWLGRWGGARIDEYYVGQERFHFRSDDEEDVLCDLKGCSYAEDPNGNDIYELPDEEWDALYKSIPWTRAIIVDITT